MTTGIVDRYEGDYVVIEIGGTMTDIPKSQVASTVKEGDVVAFIDGSWIPQDSKTDERKSRIDSTLRNMFEKG